MANMAKMKYWVQFTDSTVIKVRYFETREEALRLVEEMSDLCYRLKNRDLILDYRFEISFR